MAAVQNAFRRYIAAVAPGLRDIFQLVPHIVGGKFRHFPLAPDEGLETGDRRIFGAEFMFQLLRHETHDIDIAGMQPVRAMVPEMAKT